MINTRPVTKFCVLVLALLLVLTACGGDQSSFGGQSQTADHINLLALIMLAGGSVIFLGVMATLYIAISGSENWRQRIANDHLVIVAGLVLPIITLTALLFFSFVLMGAAYNPDGQASATGSAQHITVVGEQWWWRVIYQHEDGSSTESANEIRLQVGRPVVLELSSADVIHSFWLPAYAGKVDMVPGRTNILRFEAEESGIVRGQCAEYCGGAHARMSFYGLALEQVDFDQWLQNERSDAVQITDHEGQEVFLSTGCGGCHSVRGTAATAKIGPDLTHIASRLSLGAGVLSNNISNMATWLRDHQRLKPGNKMPDFAFLSEHEIGAISAYLAELE